MSLFSGKLTDPNKDYFRGKIVEAKVKAVRANKIVIDEVLVTADTPIPFSLKSLWFELDDLERRTFNKSRQTDSITEIITNGDAEKLISNEYVPANAGGGAPFLSPSSQKHFKFP